MIANNGYCLLITCALANNGYGRLRLFIDAVFDAMVSHHFGILLLRDLERFGLCAAGSD